MNRACQGIVVMLLLLLSGSISHGFQQASADTNASTSVEDVYAVYSALLKDPLEGSVTVGRDTVLLLQPQTAPVRLRPPSEVCFVRTPANAQEWMELLSALSAYQYKPEVLEEQKFSGGPQVKVLDDAGVAALQQQFIQDFERRMNQYSPTYPRLFQLSRVFFNQKRTLALVEVSMRCGPLCGEGRWRVLQKTNGQWENYPSPPGRPPCPPGRIA